MIKEFPPRPSQVSKMLLWLALAEVKYLDRLDVSLARWRQISN
jgi:hypothetical protein